MFAAFLGSAIRGITERLAGYDDSLANVTKMQAEQADRLASALGMIESQAHQIRFLQDRLDISRNERFKIDQGIKQVSYEFQSARAAIFARLNGIDSQIKAQDEAIESLDSVDSLQGELIGKYGTRLDALESKVNKANAELSDRIGALNAFRNSAEHVEYREVADNAHDLARKVDQRVTDLIASLQYTGAPAEFVKYTHAADLAEIVRKLVRVELNSFDFSPRIDIAVRDAAIRALANLTNDRRQSGTFAMWGGSPGQAAWGAGGAGGVNAGNGSMTKAFDSDGKPIHFDANGHGRKE